MVAKIAWGKQVVVFSVETRPGIFVLAQAASKEPFVYFLNAFVDCGKGNAPSWADDAAADAEVLFCVSVTAQFFKKSNVKMLPGVRPLAGLAIPDTWIHASPNMIKRKVALGTSFERDLCLPSGAALVKKNVADHAGGPFKHASGVFDEVIVPHLEPAAEDIAGRFEMTSLGTYPLLNERLYLCYSAGRCVSPYADIILNRPIPESYGTFVDIIAGVKPEGIY